MKHHIFTPEERIKLEANPNISKVINSNVEYTEEFKQRILREHEELDKSAKQILAEADIPDWLNQGEYAKKNWLDGSINKDILKKIQEADPR